MPNKVTLSLLAVGTFAVGTDTFVISGVLSEIARSFHVSAAAAGQLVTVFALTYAVSAPVLAALTARVPRKALLVTALGLFVVANVLGMVAPVYWLMIIARVIAGIAAGLCVPTAVVIASSIAPENMRGRSIAVVAGGMTVATALGVPLGTLIGAIGNWRATLGMVAGIALMAMVGVLILLPEVPSAPAVSLKRRLQVGAQPRILQAFGANTLACAGVFAMFTFIAPLTQAITSLDSAGVSAVLLAWGVAAVGGSTVGGWLSDKFDGTVSFTVSVVTLAAMLAALGLLGEFGDRSSAVTTAAFLIVVVVTSIACWSLPPAQNHRVAALAPEAPAVALSLNSSSSYLGFAAGGAIGGAVASRASLGSVSWAGAGIEVFTLLVLALGVIRLRVGARDRTATGRTEAGLSGPARDRSVRAEVAGENDG